MPRLFIAFKLNDKQKHQLSDLQHKIESYLEGVRWVRPENMHLTLKFLGEVGDDSLGQIQMAMDQAAEEFKTFIIRFGGCGVFPGRNKARVIWIGLKEGQAPLRELADKLESNLSGYGFKRENRNYQPHLTIGRFRYQVQLNKIDRFLEEEIIFETSTADAKEIILYESCLTKQGAIHTAIHKAFLKGS